MLPIRPVLVATAALFFWLPSVSAADRKPAPPPLVVPENGQAVLTINGQQVQAFLSPGMPNDVYLSRATAVLLFGNEAEVFGKPFGFDIGILSINVSGGGARIGPIRIAGHSAPIALGSADILPPGRAQWFETNAYGFADALAGPYALPSPIVEFQLRAVREEETSVTVPLGSRNAWWLATTPKTIGKKRVHFAFAPQFKDTVASAAAGAAIVRDLGGSFSGVPQPVEISYGVRRLAREVTLARPLVIGNISLDKILVRTRDYGSAESIADPSEIAPEAAAKDILVKGRRRTMPPSYVVYVGAEALKGCSSIRYDKNAALITLSCRTE